MALTTSHRKKPANVVGIAGTAISTCLPKKQVFDIVQSNWVRVIALTITLPRLNGFRAEGTSGIRSSGLVFRLLQLTEITRDAGGRGRNLQNEHPDMFGRR